MKKYVFITSVMILSFLIVSCDPENPNNPNAQEVITQLQITATSPTDTMQAAFSDPDGVGGIVPTVDTVFLMSGMSYSIALELIDETKNPDDTITFEIENESNV